MSRTIQRTRLQSFIVTGGDVIHGEDGSSPAAILVRGGEDPSAPTAGASGEFRAGDGLVTSAPGGPGLFRGGDGGVGGSGEFRAGDATLGPGGPAFFRAGDGTTAGGPVEFRGGNATAGAGGFAFFGSGTGTTAGGPVAIVAGDASTGIGGALSIDAGSGPAGGGPLAIAAGDGSAGGLLSLSSGDGVSGAGPLDITAGDNSGTSGGGGSITIEAGSATNGVGIGDGGSITLLKGIAAGSGSDGSIVIDYATWPAADGTTGQVLSTNGAGVLSWATGGGGGGEDLSATLAIGNFTGGTAIVTADNATGTPNTLTFTSGSHTGALASVGGGNVVITAGDTDGASGAGGDVSLVGGSPTSGDGGNIHLSAAKGVGGTDGSVVVTQHVLRGGDVTKRFQILGGTQAIVTGDSSGPSVYIKGQDGTGTAGAFITVGNGISGAGSLNARGGDGIFGSGGSGGSASLVGGAGDGVGDGAQVGIFAGGGGSSGGDGGFAFISGGLASATGSANGGGIVLTARPGIGTGDGGLISLIAGDGGATGDPASIEMRTDGATDPLETRTIEVTTTTAAINDYTLATLSSGGEFVTVEVLFMAQIQGSPFLDTYSRKICTAFYMEAAVTEITRHIDSTVVTGSASSWLGNIVASGSDIVLRIIGPSSGTVNWSATVEVKARI